MHTLFIDDLPFIKVNFLLTLWIKRVFVKMSLEAKLTLYTSTEISRKYNATVISSSNLSNICYIYTVRCENEHIFNIYTRELNTRDANGFICYECETKCRSCKENKPRHEFKKNVLYCTVYKTCGNCRHNMSVSRETKRLANLNTTADSPFPSMDTDVILYILSLVKRKKGLRFNPLMNYRHVCTRFNECICGYASHELNNADATHKETLLYLSKIGSKITTLSHWDTRYKIPECYRPDDNSSDHSDAFKLALNLYGSYDNICNHSFKELTERIVKYFIVTDTPCMFER
jgi:hypothetical protein